MTKEEIAGVFRCQVEICRFEACTSCCGLGTFPIEDVYGSVNTESCRECQGTGTIVSMETSFGELQPDGDIRIIPGTKTVRKC